ncbi:hypothetical protein GCM10027440_45220 [Nocardiopsis coralliicola]
MYTPRVIGASRAASSVTPTLIGAANRPPPARPGAARAAVRSAARPLPGGQRTADGPTVTWGPVADRRGVR